MQCETFAQKWKRFLTWIGHNILRWIMPKTKKRPCKARKDSYTISTGYYLPISVLQNLEFAAILPNLFKIALFKGHFDTWGIVNRKIYMNLS